MNSNVDDDALRQSLAPHPSVPRSEGCGAASRELYVKKKTLASEIFADLLLYAPNLEVLDLLLKGSETETLPEDLGWARGRIPTS